MAVYAIGDIQGCYEPFRRLLEKLEFDPEKDRLWLTGDLVNRGPESLKVLRFVRSLGSAVTCVLGNHDLHLIAVANGIGDAGDHVGSLDEILDADDCDELIDWLRARPLAHFSEKRNTLLVHAGLPPQWTVRKTLKRAAEVETVLRSHSYADFLGHLYGNTPSRWSGKLQGEKRLRFIVNCLTRIRMVDDDGCLDFAHKGPPANARKGLVPWFDHPEARWRGTRSLDTGCVWNRELTAVRLSDRPTVLQVDCRLR
jgi:bis(5'-nucleosyl)-tetraphosphatase (symmetrical)